ncbi:MAG TPA: MBL fold metallo-hydrolase [Candidatus Woesebacteria bacterium]|nr:MBL fold metallo-hydrolase [Candidatus Woesebacteria bacterium]
MLKYEILVVGQMKTNCYLVWDDCLKETVIIDPGDEADFISDEIEKRQLKPIGILLTHLHSDHIGAAKDLQLIYQIPILNLPNKIFDFQIIKTPGHTTGSVCFYSPTLQVVFTGDTLFKDLPARGENLDSIKKLLKLPPTTVVLPGHDEATTIGVEAGRYSCQKTSLLLPKSSN